MDKEIEKSRQRIENWSKDFQINLKREIDRFSLYVNDQCELHKYRIYEELNDLQTRLLPSAKNDSSCSHEHSILSDNESTHEDGQNIPRKRSRNATKIYSPESQPKPRGRPRKSFKTTPDDNILISRRSTRKKSIVSYNYSENDLSDDSPDPPEGATQSESCHQLLSSLSSSDFITSDPDLFSFGLPVLPLTPIQTSHQSDLLNLYQSYIMKLLQDPAPHKYQFRHYQDVYYIWGGYYQSRPFAMSFKLLVDFLHFYSDQNSYDGKTNTRTMRQAIYNLLRSGDLVLLDSIDESSVFVPLDDDKECISSKLMIALPLAQDAIEEYKEYDQEIIDELVAMYYEIYCNLVDINREKKSADVSFPLEKESFVNIFDIQSEFLNAVQAGKCDKLLQRYQQSKLKDENISWEFYLPPNDHWKMYRRYEMVDINLFYKYLESRKYVEIIKTKTKVQYLQWIQQESEVEFEEINTEI